ncbi:MAG: FAD-binding protein, partial [Raoultibacter sp.]
MEEQNNQEEFETNHRGIDRRGFLKGSALAALGFASAGALAACSPQQNAPAAASTSADAAATEEEAFVADETVDTDIVIVGCGAAGFMAAIKAAQAGAKVTVLEKGANYSAPNGIYVSGPFAVGTDVLINKSGGTTLTVDDAFNHVMDYSHWTPNPSLMRRCLEVSKDAVAELESIGYEFKEVNFRFETPFMGEKGGFHLITNDTDQRAKMWEDALSASGADVHFSTAASSIVMDGEKAVGVNAVESGRTKVTYNAKAVILASGGYLGNRDLQERFLKTRKLNVARGGESLCTGDTIIAAEKVGAALEKTFGYCPCEYGGTHEKAS